MFSSEIIKHSNSKDVAFQIWDSVESENSFAFRGVWLNQGYVESWPIQMDIFEIPKVDLKNWLKCDRPQEKCLRNSTWTPL